MSSIPDDPKTMSRHETDREDLLREATALVPRAELRLGPEQTPFFAGYRGAAVSLYFGADPVYHFNSLGALRRGFVNGCLLKAEGGRLVALQRVRSPTEVQLQRRDLDAAATEAVLSDLQVRLRGLLQVLTEGIYGTVGQFPPEADVVSMLKPWLTGVRDNLRIAASARVND